MTPPPCLPIFSERAEGYFPLSADPTKSQPKGPPEKLGKSWARVVQKQTARNDQKGEGMQSNHERTTREPTAAGGGGYKIPAGCPNRRTAGSATHKNAKSKGDIATGGGLFFYRHRQDRCRICHPIENAPTNATP